MPFSPGGIFSLVASYLATPGTNIRTEQHNPVFEDVASDLSQVLIRDGRAPMTGPLNMNGFQINNIAAGSDPNSVATLAQAMPIGAVIDFAGSIAPAGWLLCYGQAVSRTTFAALFAVIGTAFGGGDGSTTFNLPDCRGCVTAGFDAMGGTSAGRLSGFWAAIGVTGGAETASLTQANLPNVTFAVTIPAGQGSHRHPMTNYPNNGAVIVSNNVSALPQQTTNNTFTEYATLPAMSGTAASGGAGAPVSRMQPTIILNKIIRASYDG